MPSSLTENCVRKGDSVTGIDNQKHWIRWMYAGLARARMAARSDCARLLACFCCVCFCIVLVAVCLLLQEGRVEEVLSREGKKPLAVKVLGEIQCVCVCESSKGMMCYGKVGVYLLCF